MKTILFLLLFPMMAMSQTSNDIVLEYAKSKIGQRVGNGICGDFVFEALKTANASWIKMTTKRNQYGEKVEIDDVKPGDVILLASARDHVGIVIGVKQNGQYYEVVILDQGDRGQGLRKSIVMSSVYGFYKKDARRGAVLFYRPF